MSDTTTVRSGSEVLLVYPEGDADTVTVVELHHDGVVVRLPDGGLYTTVLEDIGLGVDDDLTFVLDDGCTTFTHQPTPWVPVTIGYDVPARSQAPECLICSIQIGDDPDDDLERMRCSDHSL